MTTATTAPRQTPAERALNAALGVGFEITWHGATSNGAYRLELSHPDGRALSIYTELGGTRFIGAWGRNRDRWNTPPPVGAHRPGARTPRVYLTPTPAGVTTGPGTPPPGRNDMRTYGTKHPQTEALRALMAGDEIDAVQILSKMLPGEREDLARAALKLAEYADHRVQLNPSP